MSGQHQVPANRKAGPATSTDRPPARAIDPQAREAASPDYPLAQLSLARLSSATILALQRTAGNTAVNQLLHDIRRQSVANASEGQDITVQRGGFALPSRSNPRLYVPTAVGGYTPPQMLRVATRAALRQSGVAGADVPIVMQLHPTTGAAVTYSQADLVQLGGLLQSRRGPWPALQLVQVVTQIGQALPIADLIPLLYLRPARTNPDITAFGQAVAAQHFNGMRIRSLASLPMAPPVNEVILLAPLAKSVADVAALLQPFGNVPAATAAQIVQLANVANANILQLAGLTQVHTVAEVVQLAQAGGDPLLT